MVGEPRHTDREQERAFAQLSPFELKARLIEIAGEHGTRSLLNAGRGNPNWVATTPREAFFLLGRFAMSEAKRVWDEAGIAGMPEKQDIAARLAVFLEQSGDDPGARLLQETLAYGVVRKAFDADDWVHELTDAIIGDNYPTPDRMLPSVEEVVHDYLVQELCGGVSPEGRFDLFAVEGGTAAMCYIFDTLAANCLLNAGDKIALGVPVFTPYLEIPELERYDFEVVTIEASEVDETGEHVWQYPEHELDKLADPAVRAFFLVNPSNPPSVMMRPEALDHIVGIIEHSNPTLLVITDDVYGTFVPGFRSLMAAAPRNTIGVYSFSKYFGCTGWRLGVVAVHEDNVFDQLLASLPAETKATLARRYGSISLEPESLSLIDRMVADSRQVALNHTAGLSLPQQVQMVLFALAALVDHEGAYRTRVHEILRKRLHALWSGIGLAVPTDQHRAGYYAEIDLLLWARELYGPEFAAYVEENFEPLDVVFRLAEQESIVLLSGVGFEGPEWSIRISLANLPDEAYARIGEAIARICKDYIHEVHVAQGISKSSPPATPPA